MINWQHAIGAVVLGLTTVLGLAPASATEIRGAGATFSAPAIQAWIAAYGGGPTRARFDYESVGSGEGIRRFGAGEIDFGASERPMTDSEIAAVETGVVHVPAVAGMVVVAYNIPDFYDRLYLSRRTLTGIFDGSITRWDDPRIAADNPDVTFPRRNIALIARRDAGGTTFAFTGALAAMDPDWEATGPGVSTRPAWPPYTMTANGNEGVSSRLAITDYAIGYIEFGFARRLNLPMALIENRTGAFVAPRAGTGSVALAATAAAMPVDGRQVNFDPESPDAYPIVTYSFVLLPRNRAEPAVTEAMVGFFDFALSAEGQGVAEQIGYVPLPVPVAERARALLGSVR